MSPKSTFRLREVTDLVKQGEGPAYADVFHRAGLIEKWGRGTNRVIAMLKATGRLRRVGPDKGGHWEVMS